MNNSPLSHAVLLLRSRMPVQGSVSQPFLSASTLNLWSIRATVALRHSLIAQSQPTSYSSMSCRIQSFLALRHGAALEADGLLSGPRPPSSKMHFESPY